MYHFGDPCRHCDTPHDAVEAGPCKGDPSKAIPIAFRSVEVRWDNIEQFLVRFSDGRIEQRYSHISENAPYWHFGYSNILTHPPRYDEKIRRATP